MRAIVVVGLLGATAFADEARPPRPGPPSAGSASGPRPNQDMLNPFGEAAPRRPMPPRPVPPKPAADVVTLGKKLAGTWQCKGVSLNGDGSSTPLTATVTAKLDLDDAWIRTDLVETAKGATFKLTEYRTFDATAKQWTKLQVASTSAYVTSTSLGERDGKWTWTGTQASSAGTLQLRDFEQHDGKTIKLWGEALLAGTWAKQYEATCQRR